MKSDRQRSYAIPVALLASVLAQACSTPPPAIRPPSAQETLRYNNALGVELAGLLEKRLKIKQDPQLQAYLNRMAEGLAGSVPELRVAPLSVQVISPHYDSILWQCFGLPGNRIYLAPGLIKTVKFENELAAIIAMQLAHIAKGHPIEHFLRNRPSTGAENPKFESLLPIQPRSIPESVDFFGPSGVFAYSESANLAASELAVSLLYRAGYDPRGLVALWDLYDRNIARSPYGVSTLLKMLESTRRVIAMQPPLRNPIVRSRAFIDLEKRILEF